MEFFTWASNLSKTSPVAYGLINLLVMAVIGVALAAAADLFFKALKVDLGSYKKEYEEEAGTHH
jgi:hypothetical protein